MKKQYLFSALAFSAFLASCSNEMETVTESVKQEAEMEEVVGATLVSKGMTINLNGEAEGRATNGNWVKDDMLALGWFSVQNSISTEQTTDGWELAKAGTAANQDAQKRIFANHKFIANEDGSFETQSNVYQGAHFVYFPYAYASKIAPFSVNINGNAQVTKPEGDQNPNDYDYDTFNKAFHLSAQDFILATEVEGGKLKKSFTMSPMVNPIKVVANSKVEGETMKSLKITKVTLASVNAPFAQEMTLDPYNLPDTYDEEGEPLTPAEVMAELRAHAKTLVGENNYKSEISRDIKTGYNLSENHNLNIFTFPTKAGYTADNTNDLRVFISVESPNGLKGQFEVRENSLNTEANWTNIDKLRKHMTGEKTPALSEILLDGNGRWTCFNLPVDLTNDNIKMYYQIYNKGQWDDAVALAKEIGKDTEFELMDEVFFTEEVNYPENIALTVKGNGKMSIDGDVKWPNADKLNVAEANIEVKKDATLSINGTEGAEGKDDDRNILIANITNYGTIALNEYGTVSKKDNGNINNSPAVEGEEVNGRVEVKYGSYVFADGGIIAFEAKTTTPAYEIDNLINANINMEDYIGQALVNTLVVNAENELNLNKVDNTVSYKDPYTGKVVMGGVAMPDLSGIDIEMNGGKIYGKLGDVEEVNNVKVLSGTTNSIVDVTIKGDLIVENDAKTTVDATPNIYGKKYTVYVEGDIINGGTINADVDVITTDVMNKQPGKSKLYVSTEKTVWYTETYKQGGLAEGNVLKKSLAPSTPGTDVTVVYNLEMLKAALNQNKNNIAFGANIEGDFILEQTEGNDIVIDGNGFMYTGKISLYGNARHTGVETLTIKNVNFVANSTVDFIDANSTESERRYAHNVTVESCTFTASGNDDVVAMRYRQCYNMTVKDCEATGLHSLMQANGCSNTLVENVNVNSTEGGLNMNNSQNTTVKNSKFKSNEEFSYGIRIGVVENEKSHFNTGEITLEIENSELEAGAPILHRGLQKDEKSKIVLKGTNILTTTADYQIIIAENEYKQGVKLNKATGTVTITGAEGMSIFK